ncbi:MAG: type II toxin-antitoxin system HicA family toxin [Terriglobales bacterium]
MADYAPELKRFLQQRGCALVRLGKCDHELWCSPITGTVFPVDHKILSRHTANGILKQAGLADRKRF